MADNIVTRLAEEIDSLKADPQVLRDAIVEIDRLRAELNAEGNDGFLLMLEIERLQAEIERLRVELQETRLNHITTLGELQEAAAEIERLRNELTELRATCGVLANYLHGKVPLTIVDSLWKLARRG